MRAFTFQVNLMCLLVAVSFALDSPSVIPAKAGIQSGKSSTINVLWIPAFAGMTEGEFPSLLRLLNFNCLF
jgi:hypothetical protein